MCRGMNGWRATRFRAPGAGGPFAGNWSVSSVGREIRCAGVFRAGLFAGLGLCRRDASPAVLPGHAAGMACLAYEQEGKNWRDRPLCLPGSCPREGQHGRCRLSAPRPVRKGRASVPRLQRTGDDLESLYHEAAAVAPSKPEDSVPPPSAPRTQGPPSLAPRPRITVAEPAEMKPAPKEQPFFQIVHPPTEEFPRV